MAVDLTNNGDCGSGAIKQLSALEVAVVALARSRRERVRRSARTVGSRFVGAVLNGLGYPAARPLANPRLETIRQLSATLYHRGDRDGATTAQFLALGLTAADIDAVRALVRELWDRPSRRSLVRGAGIICSTVVLAGCATAGEDRIAERDPLQKFNRGVWSANRGIDNVLIKPASTAYRKVVPKAARRGVTGVFANLTEPWSAVNNLLQLKPSRAARNFGRFAVNTTIGFGGIGDPATKMGIHTAPEDLGQTFASWGVGGGPYLVLPLFGPSTLRDGVGGIGSSFADPVSVARSEANLPSAATLGLTALETVDGRAQMTEQGVDALFETSLDPYATARSAYLQQRRSQILNEDGPEPAPAEPATTSSLGAAADPSMRAAEGCLALSEGRTGCAPHPG